MAGALKEKQLAQNVYATLQAVSCPLVEGLYLQEADPMQQLLCTPSQHRTDILAWICSSINPKITSSTSSVKAKDPDHLIKELALCGQELMLCEANDLDLIKGEASHWRQLRFLEQLLTLIPRGEKSAELREDGEGLLQEHFAPENLPYLTQMLNPTVDPWPADIRTLLKGQESSSHRLNKEEVSAVEALLLASEAALEELKSECEFVRSTKTPGGFSPSELRVVVSDLCQLMAAFGRVYESDFKPYCNQDPPSLSSESQVFVRVHRLLQACNMELEVLEEVSEASESLTDKVNELQTKPHCWSHGEKRTLSEQLEELTRQYRDLLQLNQV